MHKTQSGRKMNTINNTDTTIDTTVDINDDGEWNDGAQFQGDDMKLQNLKFAQDGELLNSAWHDMEMERENERNGYEYSEIETVKTEPGCSHVLAPLDPYCMKCGVQILEISGKKYQYNGIGGGEWVVL